MNEMIELLNIHKDRMIKAIDLLEYSISNTKKFEIKEYNPAELEPYDAMSGRFIRAVELGFRFFRTYEKYIQGENSDTYRDILNNISKQDLITSTEKWMMMRDLRNRIMYEYLPEEQKIIYDLIMGEYGKELIELNKKIKELNFK